MILEKLEESFEKVIVTKKQLENCGFYHGAITKVQCIELLKK